MTVTIRDLARMTNTSVATVSRAIGNKPGVTPETRGRIVQLAESLGYQPNRNAQSLVQQKTHLIGLIASALRNPWYVEFLGRMESFCADRGYQILVTESQLNPQREQENINTMLQHQAEGLVIFPVSDWLSQENFDYFLKLKLRRFPFVLIGRVEGYGFDCVYTEEVESAMRLTEHLLNLGHTRFGMVDYDPRNRPARERLEGIKKALVVAGLLNGDEPITEPVLRVTQYHRGAWRANLESWFTSPNPPTALIPTNCGVGLELYRPLTEMGLRIPEEVSVASFDDPDWVKHLVPSMTVCRPDDEKVIHLALETLVERIHNPAGPTRVHSIPQELIMRESTGPAITGGSKKLGREVAIVN
jgi:LacI family transcriptional regulator